MLFNSHEYLLLFLPITLLVFLALRGGHGRLALGWLTVASLGFYAWWHPSSLLLLLGTLVVNFGLGRMLLRPSRPDAERRCYLVLGVVGNLSLLAWFKYAGFLVANWNAVVGTQWDWAAVTLPLGISFFTFQKIAYLSDCYRGRTIPHTFLEYCLFVAFFPQLIAGPIVHPGELLPQLTRPSGRTPQERSADLAIGFTILCFGLFKKVVLADGVAVYATPVFTAAANGTEPSLLPAWGAALAYTLQLYFDFSGYSDMALGSARLFGVRLPLNFHSPYQSTSLAEFWRRWHMTLSRFLRDYLYFPLGGSRCGRARRSLNLVLTMTLGGLWHGANWTFVLWGVLHGVGLAVNHVWRDSKFGPLPRPLAIGVTFLFVVAGWVLFRADSLASAGSVYAGMMGLNGLELPLAWQSNLAPLCHALGMTSFVTFARMPGFDPLNLGLTIGGLLAVVWLCPNTQQVMVRCEPALAMLPDDEWSLSPRWWHWRPNQRWAITTSLLGLTAVLKLSGISEFLYFQF